MSNVRHVNIIKVAVFKVTSDPFKIKVKSNQSLFVTCAEYNRCSPYSEILTYRL